MLCAAIALGKDAVLLRRERALGKATRCCRDANALGASVLLRIAPLSAG
ncbi:MAG: hypothetical protein QOJ46_251 [bacterium]